MACHTQEEIAAAEDVAQQTLSDLVKSFTEIGNLAKSGKAAAEHATDFDPPIYNVPAPGQSFIQSPCRSRRTPAGRSRLVEVNSGFGSKNQDW